MEAPKENVKIRSSYNLSGCSFTPSQIAKKIKNHLPDFTISYTPDFRQAIADSWPKSIDDSNARNDWGWKEEFNEDKIVEVMLLNVNPELV